MQKEKGVQSDLLVCIALYVLHQLLIQPFGFIDILDYAKLSCFEWISIINDLLGKVPLEGSYADHNDITYDS